MNKLNLSLDTLRVQSFPTEAPVMAMRGTAAIAAEAGTSRCAYTDCTCPGQCIETE
jgi:hypothetical protein